MSRTNFKLTKDSCRRCGRDTHATTSCPNVASGHHSLAHRSDSAVEAAVPAIAAGAEKIDYDTAKRTAVKEARRSSREARRAAKQLELVYKVAVYESLLPFGVEARNVSYFRGSNWATEDVSFCKRCGKPEPKNGCWCMPHKV